MASSSASLAVVRFGEFEANLRSRLEARAVERILAACADQGGLERMPVHEFVGMFVV